MKENDTVAGVIVMVLRRLTTRVEILFLRRSGGKYQGQWWPVGGTSEAGETAIQTALRELREETGLEARELYELGWQVFHIYGVSRLSSFVAFVSSAANVTLNHEHSEFKWVTYEEALEVSPDKDFILHLHRNFMRGAPRSKPVC